MTEKKLTRAGAIDELNKLCVAHHPNYTGEAVEAETFTPLAQEASEAYNDAEAQPSEKRRCSQKNKKGEPCGAWALKSDSLGRCPAHAGVALKHLDPAKAQKRSAELRKMRNAKAKRSAQEVLAAKLEENAEELVEILLKAARAGEWRVVAMMWDRIYGRPKETVEHQQEEPEAIRALRALTPEQRMILWRNRGLQVVDDEQEETA